ncbi:MAG: VOC family protein [Maricaulaceae bacterium]
MAQDRPRFHLAFPVHDLDAARAFYKDLLGCVEGRSAETWVDFDLHGHQIVAHHAPDAMNPSARNAVDGHDVPAFHFGLILNWSDWSALGARLKRAGAGFLIDPYVRFEGEPGEQGTFFVKDPSGNALEFKAFRDEGQIFAV